MSAMIDIRHLRKEYRAQAGSKSEEGTGIVAVNDLCLELEAGDVFGFIGPNGAGKTTTFKMLCGLIAPTSGTALINGVDVTRFPDRIRGMVGYMPDVYGLYDDIKVWEYLDFFASAYRIPRDKRTAAIADALALTDLTAKKQAYVSALSRGMQQRLCLARTLIHDPQTLLLDEPASGLDPHARIELRELFKELQVMGKTLIISSHILPEMEEFCNKIGIMERGELIVSGDVNTIARQVQGRQSINIEIVEDLESARAVLLSLTDLARNVRVTHGGHAPSDASDASGEKRDAPALRRFSPEQAGTIEIEYVGAANEEYKILTLLVQAGVKVRSFQPQRTNLEDVFLRVTKGQAS